jgi:hypothetical protein
VVELQRRRYEDEKAWWRWCPPRWCEEAEASEGERMRASNSGTTRRSLPVRASGGDGKAWRPRGVRALHAVGHDGDFWNRPRLIQSSRWWLTGLICSVVTPNSCTVSKNHSRQTCSSTRALQLWFWAHDIYKLLNQVTWKQKRNFRLSHFLSDEVNPKICLVGPFVHVLLKTSSRSMHNICSL